MKSCGLDKQPWTWGVTWFTWVTFSGKMRCMQFVLWPAHLLTKSSPWNKLASSVTTSSEYFLSSFTIAPLNSLFFSQEVKLTCLKKHYNLQLMKTWSISFCNWSGVFVCFPSGKDSMQFSSEFISLLIGQLALKLSRWYQYDRLCSTDSCRRTNFACRSAYLSQNWDKVGRASSL